MHHLDLIMVTVPGQSNANYKFTGDLTLWNFFDILIRPNIGLGQHFSDMIIIFYIYCIVYLRITN